MPSAETLFLLNQGGILKGEILVVDDDLFSGEIHIIVCERNCSCQQSSDVSGGGDVFLIFLMRDDDIQLPGKTVKADKSPAINPVTAVLPTINLPKNKKVLDKRTFFCYTNSC